MSDERHAPEIDPKFIEAAYQEIASLHRREGQLLVEPGRCQRALDILLDEARWDWDGHTLQVHSRHGSKAKPKWAHYYVDDGSCWVDDDGPDLRPCVDREMWKEAEPDFFCKHRAARLILERAYELKRAQEIVETLASVAA